MKYKLIIGSGIFFETACRAWKKDFPETTLNVIEIPQKEDFEFDYSVLDGIDSKDVSVFIAFDERFGNFKRMELVLEVQRRGFKIDSYISKSASVADGVNIGENVFVGDNVTVAHGTVIGFNTVIHAGTNIGAHVNIASSCWFETGVQIGTKANIGRHTIVRMGAIVGKSVQIGWGCELGWPQFYGETVPDKTTFDTRYDEPIYVYGI